MCALNWTYNNRLIIKLHTLFYKFITRNFNSII